MKNKFENQENGSMLGTTIQQVRKAKGITQEDLGKRVGLPKSSISKIEKGLTHISFEDASLLMDAMGEKISIQVMGMKEPDEKRVERVRFVTIGVTWYAHNKKMAFADATRVSSSWRRTMHTSRHCLVRRCLTTLIRYATGIVRNSRKPYETIAWQ